MPLIDTLRPVAVLLAACLAWLAPARANDLFEPLHAASEALYDGNGSWGCKRHGWRMPLRDAAWRADVYGALAQRGGQVQGEVYRRRAAEAIGYLLRAQAEGGTGVFGFPADVRHPEFGSKVAQVMQRCPACVHQGWIITLPAGDVAELYYDHGHALAAVARAYQRTGNPALLPAVRQGADWALDQPLTRNVNYLSSLSKGLSLAWRATGDARYLERAVALHRQGILPLIGPSGDALDPHNAQLEYHGFIVSGLVALRQALPGGHAFVGEADRALALTAARMAERGQTEAAPFPATWPGTNLQAWQELGALRPLSAPEAAARERAVALIRDALPRLLGEGDALRLRKALYSYFFVGLE